MSAAPAGPPRLWPLYAGGFLGPFGGAMTSTMLPEIAGGLHTSVGVAATATTWYLIPFSLVMLASGTVAGRFGEARAVRTAFVVYAVACLIGAAATAPVVFMGGRALQGVANAFTSPLLISMLLTIAPPGRRGRAMGIYASMLAAGSAFAPLVGGAAASVDYRLAFVAAAVAALTLGALTPGIVVTRENDASGRERWRALLNRPLALASAIATCLQFTSTAIGLLVALLASDRFGLAPTQRGLVVAAFGVAGLVTGTSTGRLADRIGLRPVGVATLVLLGLGMAATGVVPSLPLLIAATFVAGAGSTGSRVLAQTLAMRSTPANPSGATSLAMAIQFLGGAAAPAMLSVYHASPWGACALTGAVALVGALVALVPAGADRPAHGTPPTAP